MARRSRRVSRVAKRTKRPSKSKRRSKVSRKSARKSAKRSKTISYETSDDLPIHLLRKKIKKQGKFVKRKSKKGPSPYNKFVKKMSPVLRKKNPGMKQPNIMKLIAKEWNAQK